MTQVLHLPGGITLKEVKRTQMHDRTEIYFTADGRDLREGNNRLHLSLYYSKGGANYFSGTSEARGFYVSVGPVYSDGQCVSARAFSGIKILVKEVSRFSANILPTLEDQAIEFLKEAIRLRSDKYFESEKKVA